MLFPSSTSPDSFIIAEVGQNHQGSVELAKRYVDIFSDMGADAIKFQMRDNKSLFSRDVFDKPYNSENSFGSTYGEHREFLELTVSELKSLKKRCQEKGVYFMVTPFDECSLERALEIDVDIIKIASFDLGNLPFLEKINATGRPVVLSTGGGRKEHFSQSLQVFNGRGLSLAVLHCVSLYPCPAEKLRLGQLDVLSDLLGDHALGLSDHFNGILSGPLAFLRGARVFEKHVTMDRSQKGTDHSFSLEPNGFSKFCRDLRRVPLMFDEGKPSDGSEPVFQKLGKTVVARSEINPGDAFTADNIVGKITGENGVPIRDIGKILGKKSNRKISIGKSIGLSDAK